MTALHQAGRWDAVVAAAQQLARLDPDNPDPGGIVSDAQAKIREADLADRYAQALNELDQQQWQQAADLFAAIEQEHPGYRDAAALLKTAQRQRDLSAWSDQAAAAAGTTIGTLRSSPWKPCVRSIPPMATLVHGWNRHGPPSDAAHWSTK